MTACSAHELQRSTRRPCDIYAVVAPDNSGLPKGLSNQDVLKQMVLNSIVGEALKTGDLKSRSTGKTLGGKDLPVKVIGGRLTAVHASQQAC